MAVAALVTWLVAAVLGFVMVGMWLGRGGMRADVAAVGVGTHLPPPLVFTHAVLAALGLVVWVVYLFVDLDVLVWVAFAVLVIAAGLGELLFLRWWHSRRDETPEASLPTALVYAHGAFAVATAVLVFLIGLGVGVPS